VGWASRAILVHPPVGVVHRNVGHPVWRNWRGGSQRGAQLYHDTAWLRKVPSHGADRIPGDQLPVEHLPQQRMEFLGDHRPSLSSGGHATGGFLRSQSARPTARPTRVVDRPTPASYVGATIEDPW